MVLFIMFKKILSIFFLFLLLVPVASAHISISRKPVGFSINVVADSDNQSVLYVIEYRTIIGDNLKLKINGTYPIPFMGDVFWLNTSVIGVCKVLIFVECNNIMVWQRGLIIGFRYVALSTFVNEKMEGNG